VPYALAILELHHHQVLTFSPISVFRRQKDYRRHHRRQMDLTHFHFRIQMDFGPLPPRPGRRYREYLLRTVAAHRSCSYIQTRHVELGRFPPDLLLEKPLQKAFNVDKSLTLTLVKS